MQRLLNLYKKLDVRFLVGTIAVLLLLAIVVRVLFFSGTVNPLLISYSPIQDETIVPYTTFYFTLRDRFETADLKLTTDKAVEFEIAVQSGNTYSARPKQYLPIGSLKLELTAKNNTVHRWDVRVVEEAVNIPGNIEDNVVPSSNFETFLKTLPYQDEFLSIEKDSTGKKAIAYATGRTGVNALELYVKAFGLGMNDSRITLSIVDE